jgi:hypothetical protein
MRPLGIERYPEGCKEEGAANGEPLFVSGRGKGGRMPIVRSTLETVNNLRSELTQLPRCTIVKAPCRSS